MSACCGPHREPTGTRPRSWETRDRKVQATPPATDFVNVPSGCFTMGTDDPSGHPDDGEGPAHVVELDDFAIARHAVTNEEFAAFVTASGYRTTAERLGDSFVFAGLLPADFPPTQAVAAAPWWRLVPGANWRHPEGPQSDLRGRARHPVVHVSWDDAQAYCAWSNTRLPTEAEWERAARGGLAGTHFPWGHEREPGGEHRMNVYQGDFPHRDLGSDGWIGTCPVGSFAPNGFGLYEVTGNVWEWCADWFDATYYARSPREDPTGPLSGQARVMRGGSYLCHESYCSRYRVDARSSNTPDSTTGNLGLRVVPVDPRPTA